MRAKVVEKSRAIQLRKNGLSVKQIAQKLSVSKGSVSPWVKLVVVPKEKRKKIRERMLMGGEKGRKKILRGWDEYRILHPKPPPYVKPVRLIDTFFDKWSPEMAYVLGYFAADGCMFRNKRGSYYIEFTSTDIELIACVKSILESTNKLERYKLKNPKYKIRYNIQLGSKSAFLSLNKLGLTPNKSLIIKFPAVPDEYLGHFLRGNLDGDGCVTFTNYFRKDRGKRYLSLMIRFTSGSRVFLVGMKNRIEQKIPNIGGSLILYTPRHHVLAYCTSSARQLYKIMYPNKLVPCLKRKRDIFLRAFEILDP
ncbi:MAG: LAGLIDADG family homing endonuclease [bacterium]|nr:LAGLIDADG family homing endonuclease [bacterium]